MDKIGALCRSAEDCGIVLQTIAGKDGNDPGSAGKSFYYAPQFARDLKTVRVGYSPADFEQLPDPAARPAFLAALEVVKSMGVNLVEVKMADLPYDAVARTVIAAEGSSVFEELIESGKVDELADKKQIAGLKAGLEIASRDYLKAMRVRRLIQQEFRRVLTGVDILAAPTHFRTALKINEPLDRAPASGSAQARSGLASLIDASNLAGLPALCVPCGFSEGLPVALQFVSRPFTENLILNIGAEFQKRTDWHRRRPPA
jgi:aspartyl-tRNA(Asn)/glutamyl-tRNA(Gln) amidotransferase subunit A